MTKKRQRSPYILILIFIILTAGIAFAGYLYYQYYKENYRVVVEHNLSAIAKLKVDGLVHWRNERLGDAGIFYKNTAFSALVRRYFETPDDTETKGQIKTWLSQVQAAYEYDRVSLFDAQGIERISATDTHEPVSHSLQDVAESLHSGKVSFLDFSRHSADGRIHLGIMVPVIAGQKGNQVIGVIALCIDPENFLYPLINQWPTPSKTAESLLIRRQGNEALFLNELRFKKNTALNLRVPLDKNKELPAVKAVLGQEGIVEGTDYRGVPVIAFVCAVPDSPWFLVARMDTSEVYAPLKEKLWVAIVLVGILLTGTSAGVGFIWKQQLAGFNRQKCEASKSLMGSEGKYQSLVEATPDLIWEIDREGVYTYVSPRVKDLLGYEVSEVLGKTSFDLMSEKEAARTRKIFMEKMVEKEPFYGLENINRHKDGHLVVLESSGVPAFDDNGQFQGYRGTDRDITERKRAEETLRESEERYKNLFKVNIDGILIADATTKKFRYANPAICRMLGYSEEELTQMGVADIHPKESLEQVSAEFEAQSSGAKITADLQCVRKDGQIISVSINAGTVMIGQTKYLMGIFRDITERRQAEQVAKKAREYAESIVETVREPLIVLDATLKVISANHSFYQTFKVNPEESKGRFIYDLGNRQWDIPKLRTLLEDILPKNNVFDNYEIEHNFETIGPKTMLLNARHLDTAQMVLLAIEDITDRRQAERDLHESKNYLENLINYASAPIIVWTPDSKITRFNHAFEHLTGRSAEEVLGKELSILFPEENREQSLLEIKRTLGGDYWESVEIPTLHKDGSVRVALWNSANIYAEDGATLMATIAQGMDITDRKRAEEALKESKERLELALSAASMGTWRWNIKTDQDTRDANFNSMLGLKAAESTQSVKDFIQYVHPDDRAVVDEEIKRAIRERDIYRIEFRIVRPDGTIYWLSDRGKTYYDQKNEPAYMTGAVFNITERKQMEENLRLSKTQAEAANEAKSRFLANISHEIRTPLNSIIGFSEILMQEELAEEQKEHLRIVYNSGKHLLCLIGDILDFSRIEAGKMNIEMEQCSLGQLIAKIESMMQPFATEKGLTFEIREKGDLPANIVTDAVHLQQCLINLVNNAIKFTEQGHIYVNISLEDKDSKPRIRFEVEDTGTGIAPESQQKIFEPFVQEDGSTSRKYGGTGLGLTITKKLAELLGGELTLTSEKGKGSVFSLVIPAGVDPATQPLLDRQEIIDDISKAKQDNFSGCILVAEDVESNQMLMKFLLDRMGLKVTIAENGAEAVNKALGQKFDLIFMDIQMPQVNGYEATRTLRSKGIKTPIVALTAGAMEGDDKKSIDAGCDDYLPKPVVLSKLIETLSKYLENNVLPKDGVSTARPDNDKVNENYLSQMDIPDNEGIIDWAQAAALGLDEQSMKEIIPTYMNDNKEHLRGLITAVKTSNAKDVQSHAHAIKGAGRNLGAARLSELAGQLQTMALKEDLSEAEELLKDITSEFHRLEEFVSKPDWIEMAKEQSTNRLELGSNRKSS